jgi:hypothetical protein
LLTPIEQASDENLHTRALAYLFNPGKPHGFGKDVFAAILEKLPQGAEMSEVSRLAHRERLTVNVEAEYRSRIEALAIARSLRHLVDASGGASRKRR